MIPVACVYGALLAISAHAAEVLDAAAAAPPSGAAARTSRTPRASALDERIALLTAELNLDAGQQAGVRKLLEEQREQVRRVWNDVTIPAGSRVGATRAISERTADQIRALLTDEQKKKYLAARQPHAPSDEPAKPSLDDWMNTTRH
jgi:protein CpxP